MRSVASLTRDRRELGVWNGPGSAAHRHSAAKTRVNALMALRSIRGTTSLILKSIAQRRVLKNEASMHLGLMVVGLMVRDGADASTMRIEVLPHGAFPSPLVGEGGEIE
ncbi:hypothetical protein ACSVBT_19685 [Afipia sp. TerB]